MNVIGNKVSTYEAGIRAHTRDGTRAPEHKGKGIQKSSVQYRCSAGAVQVQCRYSAVFAADKDPESKPPTLHVNLFMYALQ